MILACQSNLLFPQDRVELDVQNQLAAFQHARNVLKFRKVAGNDWAYNVSSGDSKYLW
jgi:hypothetical protein